MFPEQAVGHYICGRMGRVSAMSDNVPNRTRPPHLINRSHTRAEMNAIDKLISSGRNPLEILFIPLADDVAEWIEQDRIAKLDEAIRRELLCWSLEMRERLWQLIEQRKA